MKLKKNYIYVIRVLNWFLLEFCNIVAELWGRNDWILILTTRMKYQQYAISVYM